MRFKIEFNDPETGEPRVEYKDFEESFGPKITAREWAEDWAYSAADKGRYELSEAPNP
jgi:hypothetical protein